MAFFLTIEGHAGESLEMPKSIDVLEWTCAASLFMKSAGAKGQRPGQSDVTEINVSAASDKSLVALWKSICSGNPIKKAEIVGLKDVQGKPTMYFKLTLTDCYIASMALGAFGGEDMNPSSFNIKFNHMQLEYFEFKKDGTRGDQPKVSFDQATHKAA